MTLWPVVTREMSVLARRKSTYFSRAAAGLTGVVVISWLVFLSASQAPGAQQGQEVFLLISAIALMYALFTGAGPASDCLSVEKREGTLGLLFLTDLRGADVVLGKLAASSLTAFYLLLAVLPMITVAVLLGGVTLAQVGKAALVLINTAVLSVSAGVFVSALSKNERKATFATAILLGAVVTGPFFLALVVSNFENLFIEEIILLSPIYPFLCLHIGPAGVMGTEYFWISMAVMPILSAAFLRLAALILPRCVNEAPKREGSTLGRTAAKWMYGDRKEKAEHRRRLLDKNAFLWLAGREKAKPQYAWGVLAAFTVLYLWIVKDYPDMALDVPIFGMILFLVHFIFKVWTASEVCSRLVEDRRSGALELLLSSPLNVRDIARGQHLALQRIFGKPILVLIAAEIALFSLCLNHDRNDANPGEITILFGAAITTLLIDLWALKWLGLWHSLFGTNISRMLGTTLFKIMAAPWLLFAAVMTLGAVASAIAGLDLDPPEVMLSWWVISLVVSLVFGGTARSSFLQHFREAAANRFSASTRQESPLTVWLRDFICRSAGVARWVRRVPRPLRAHWMLTASACVLLVLYAGATARKIYWRMKVERQIAAIKAKGEPAGIVELGKVFPPVPAKENLVEFAKTVGGLNWAGRGFVERHSTPLGPDQLKEYQKLRTANAAQLAAFWKVTNCVAAYVPPGTPNAWRTVHSVNQLLQIVRHDLTLAAELGEQERVENHVGALLHTSKLLRTSRSPQMQNMALQTLDGLSWCLERLLKESEPRAEFLVSVVESFKALREIEPLRDELIWSRAVTADFSNSMDTTFMNGTQRAAVLTVAGLLTSVGVRHEAAARYVADYTAAIEVAAKPLPDRLNVIRELSQEREKRNSHLHFMFLNAPPLDFLWSFQMDAAIQARLAVMEAGVARYLYWERGGEGEPELPGDPYTGKPLQLKIVGEEEVIFSFGNDGDDDQGAAARHLNSDGDITFRIPRRQQGK